MNQGYDNAYPSRQEAHSKRTPYQTKRKPQNFRRTSATCKGKLKRRRNQGLVDLLLACPVKDWFVPLDRSELTDTLPESPFIGDVENENNA